MPSMNQGVLDGVRRIGAAFRSVSVGGGIAGAPSGYRMMGATQAGSPASGTWRAGDHVEDRTGKIWICTASGTPGTWVPSGMSLLATTGLAGYALVNGTGNIITWTAPNDGQLHRVLATWNLRVTSGETGGQLGFAYTLPDTTATTFAGAISAGGASTGTSVSQNTYFVQPGTTFSVKQNSALTGGAAVLWVDLWGS